MTASLKHTLNPSFALLFAVGVDRLYKVLDAALHAGNARYLMTPKFSVPLAMVLLTLIFGTLSSVANDQFLETQSSVAANSYVAIISYTSVLCALWMFYFSTDLGFLKFWWLGYAALCLVNALWNRRAISGPNHKPHVFVNVAVAAVLLALSLVWPSALTSPRWFIALLFLLGVAKCWQRGHQRFAPTDHDPAER